MKFNMDFADFYKPHVTDHRTSHIFIQYKINIIELKSVSLIIDTWI